MTAPKAPDPVEAPVSTEAQVAARAAEIQKGLPARVKAEHSGETTDNVKAVGRDTGIAPGKNVGLQAISKEAHDKAKEEVAAAGEQRRTSRAKLTMEDLQKMSAAEIRAVAKDRGYELRPGGWRSVSRQFLDKQTEDKFLG